MAAAAGFSPEVMNGERYAGSLAAERAWYGKTALKAAGVYVEEVEIAAAVENSWQDHWTALAENIATTKEGQNLTFGVPITREIVEGHVVDKNGRKIIDIVREGAVHSAWLAQKDSAYKHQSIRDEGDVYAAEAFDDLEVGETALVPSFYPEEWYETHPALCDSIGYRRGMTVLHIAHRVDEKTMVQWPFTIKMSNKRALSQALHEVIGMSIPYDTHSDLWSRHLHREKLPEAWSKQLGVRILERHQKLAGTSVRYSSAEGFLGENVEQIRALFDTYFPHIKEALGTQRNTPELQGLAGSILQAVGSDSEKLKPAVRSQLIHLANSDKFTDDDARLMKVMVRYATLEILLPKLPDYLNRMDGSQTNEDRVGYKASRIESRSFDAHEVFGRQPATVSFIGVTEHAQVQHMNHMLALNIANGIKENRGGGGCEPINLLNNYDVVKSGVLANNIFEQDSSDRTSDETEMEDCDFISKECPKCGAKDVKTECRKGVYYGACGCTSK
ncbi:hypothetical protein KC992_02210 [Candidatus Saccharibacteria bacterium]|nr:hypothetical protein [Candidatus Saccharibacteria bacterium]